METPLDAIGFQRMLEERFYTAGGEGYIAPAQRAADFLKGKLLRSPGATTYRPGVVPARLDDFFPPRLADALKAGLSSFARRMPGFVVEGVLIGLESRTSSPVRFPRDANFCSVSTSGLYVLGEGAGYAGGIMICARDAVEFAQLVRPRG